jgi:RNA-directed DNA polymerase
VTQSMEGSLPCLDQLVEMAKHNKTVQFNNLLHHLNLAMLTKAFYHLNKRAARGVDNMGWYDYQTEAKKQLVALQQWIQSGRYKA